MFLHSPGGKPSTDIIQVFSVQLSCSSASSRCIVQLHLNALRSHLGHCLCSACTCRRAASPVSTLRRVNPPFGRCSLHESPCPHLCTIVSTSGCPFPGLPYQPHVVSAPGRRAHPVLPYPRFSTRNLHSVHPSCGLIRLPKPSLP